SLGSLKCSAPMNAAQQAVVTLTSGLKPGRGIIAAKYQECEAPIEVLFADKGRKLAAMSMSRDGSVLVVGSVPNKLQQEGPARFEVYDLSIVTRQGAFDFGPKGTGHLNGVAVSPDGKWLVSSVAST